MTITIAVRVRLRIHCSAPKSRVIYGLVEPWLGQGLLVSNGAKWARSRRLLTPAFHFDILKQYLHVKNRASAVLVVGFTYDERTLLQFYTRSYTCLIYIVIWWFACFDMCMFCWLNSPSHTHGGFVIFKLLMQWSQASYDVYFTQKIVLQCSTILRRCFGGRNNRTI